MDTISERLKKLRKEILNLTQDDFGTKIGFKRNTIALMETGRNAVTDRTIADICREFNVNEEWLRHGNGEIFTETPSDYIDAICEENDFGALEKTILTNFIHFNKNERKSFIEHLTKLTTRAAAPAEINVLQLISESFTSTFNVIESSATSSTLLLKDITKPQHQHIKEYLMPKEEPEYVACILHLPLYTQKASAGLGNYFVVDDDEYTIKEFYKEDVPLGAEFCIIADGNSMVPLIQDGQTLFIKPAISIENGQIGIFILNSEVLCKKLIIDYENNKVLLRSLNNDYIDIVVQEDDNLKTIGRVLL